MAEQPHGDEQNQEKPQQQGRPPVCRRHQSFRRAHRGLHGRRLGNYVRLYELRSGRRVAGLRLSDAGRRPGAGRPRGNGERKDRHLGRSYHQGGCWVRTGLRQGWMRPSSRRACRGSAGGRRRMRESPTVGTGGAGETDPQPGQREVRGRNRRAAAREQAGAVPFSDMAVGEEQVAFEPVQGLGPPQVMESVQPLHGARRGPVVGNVAVARQERIGPRGTRRSRRRSS